MTDATRRQPSRLDRFLRVFPGRLLSLRGWLFLAAAIGYTGSQGEQPADAGKVDALVGAWSGSVCTDEGPVRVELNISAQPDGVTVSLDSPDQGVSGMPASGFAIKGEEVTMRFHDISARYVARVAHGRLDGQWSQGRSSSQLVLTADTRA